MGMVAFSQRIASAHTVSRRKRGEVTRLARAREVSRQRIYREADWVSARLTQDAWQQKIKVSNARIQELERHNESLARQLSQAVVVDEDKQAELTVVGQALGASLPEMRVFLSVLLPGRVPSVSKLGRWAKAAGQRSGALLAVLDEFSGERVRQALADEIYVSDPVLMVVEPESLCWTTAKLVKRTGLTGSAWADELEAFSQLEQMTSDAGRSLQSGLKEVNERRRAAGLPDVAGQGDHFHALMAGGSVLAGLEKKVRGALAKADEAEARCAERRRNGQAFTSERNHARACWAKANQLFDQWSTYTGTWQKVKEALPLVTPEGELNTRARAEAILAETLPQLPDASFGKCKRLLQHKNALTFLDSVQKKLQDLPVPAELRNAALRQETLRRCPEKCRGESAQGAVLRGMLLVCAVILQKAGTVGQQAVDGVRKIFRETWRASSLIECINSVLRMQQARHRKMTQGLLDLKRLYWNTHMFRTGRRKGKRPYDLIGLPWPNTVCWWQLLKWSPEQLRAELSARKKAK
jgi:hypothetical protein